jgi:hypothetical protein
MLTVDEMMSYKPCNDYPRERVVELWAGSEALSAQQIADLEISAQDRIWALCAWLARLDRASLSAFARGRADRARQHASAAYAAYAAYYANAASAAAADADAYYARAAYAAAAAAADAAADAYYARAASAAAAAAYYARAAAAERQEQLNELVRMIEAAGCAG